mgnify:CR=1 FL=1
MSRHRSEERIELSDSALTVPSDSENYSANNEFSSSPSASNSPLDVYKPPSIWRILRGAAINLLLPFINGLMLGLGELIAHEAAFRLGWSGTKVGHRAPKLGPKFSPGTDRHTRSSRLIDARLRWDQALR